MLQCKIVTITRKESGTAHFLSSLAGGARSLPEESKLSRMSATRDSQPIMPPGTEWTPGFDVTRATDAYIATIPASERVQSDAYFEGGYWLGLWGTLITVTIAWILLSSRFSARLRDFTERHFRRVNPPVLAYTLVYLAVVGLLTLPWEIYTGFFREHAYGMSNQTLGGFLRDWGVGFAVNAALGGLALTGLYAILRRVGRRWIGWATLASGGFLFLLMLISPVFIAPLFNDYRPLPAGEVRESILQLARENDVPADDVYWFDASRQTKRISANVSGVLGTTRIALNDNLLEGTSLPEIRAVMAHEMGHYALHHSYWLPLGLTLVFGFGFWVVDKSFDRIVRRHGRRWGVRGLADPAGLPLIVAIFGVTLFLLTPVINNMIRFAENRADAYGLDAAREPHGFASTAMRLSSYRKLEPSALEEAILFDHPSGRTRVERSMRWLAEHPPASAAAGRP
jgi:STE24 endopeptidase